MLLKNNALFHKVRLIYMCFIVIYMAVRMVVPLQFLIENVLVSLSVFAVGFLLVVWDLLTERSLLKSYGIDILVLFVLVCLVSSVINFKYGIGGNIKAVGALVLQFFVFYSMGVGATKEQKQKDLKAVSATLCVIWGLFAIASTAMYFFDIEYTIVGGSWGKATHGFSAEYQRLWGIFNDPNYASFASVITVFASVFLMMNNKRVISYVCGGVSVFIQLTYIVLAGSRAATLLLLAATFLLGLYWFLISAKKSFKNLIVGLVSTVAAVAVVFVCIFAVRNLIPVCKTAVNRVSTGASQKVTAVYDTLYNSAGVEMYQTYTSDSNSSENENDNTIDTPDDSSSAVTRTDTDKDDISNGRFKRWRHTLQIFLKAPVFGTSPRNVSAFAKDHAPDTLMAIYGIAPHNGYLDVLVGTGIIGMLVLLSFLALVVAVTVKKLITQKYDLSLAFAAASIFVLAGSAMLLSDIYMIFTFGSAVFFMMAGYAVNGEKKNERSITLRLFNSVFCRKQKRGN